MTNRDPNLELMAHWMQAWKTLGRWQALNARLSRDAAPQRRNDAATRSGNSGGTMISRDSRLLVNLGDLTDR